METLGEGEQVVVDPPDPAAVRDRLVGLGPRFATSARRETLVLDRAPKMMFFSDSVATT